MKIRASAPVRRTALAACCLAILLASPLSAQKRPAPSRTATTPETAAREMYGKRLPAAETAKQLMEGYRQTPDEVVLLLAAVGYRGEDVAATAITSMRMSPESAAASLRRAKVPAAAVGAALAGARVSADLTSGALRSAGYPAAEATRALVEGHRLRALDAYQSLQTAGYSVVDLARGLTELGVPIDMDCIGPTGEPAPCGNFGSGTNQPAMGQVTWSPQGSGQVGTMLTFESTNIPALDVLLGDTELEVVEMNSNRLRARLPDTPTAGALVFRRHSDAVTGVIEPYFEVTEAPPEPVAVVDWSEAADAALEGALSDADLWIMGARFRAQSCSVNAGVATGSSGVLENPSGFMGTVKSKLRLSGAPDVVAEAWQQAFEDAFLSWADGVTIPGLPWYPAFVTYPGAEAPPVPNVPVPLALLISAGTPEMTPLRLAERLRSDLPDASTPEAETAIDVFATELGATFGLFLSTASVMNVLGHGPVPSFAPPAVPVGPVQDGECFSPGMWSTRLPSGTQVGLPDIG